MYRNGSVLTAALAALSLAACTGNIRWEGSIEEALELSGRDCRPVMLYFTFVG